MNVTVRFRTVEDVKRFCGIIGKYEFQADFVSGRYVVDAKSIMGIYSLNLNKDVTLIIHEDDCDVVRKFLNEISDLLVKEN